MRVRFLAGLLVLGLIAAACSGDDGSTPAAHPSSSRPPTTPPTTRPPATTAPAPPRLTVLVTNDDGVEAPGIDTLVRTLTERTNHNVVVIAPAREQPTISDATAPAGVSWAQADTASGQGAIAVDGFPADTVLVALNELRIEPDVVISGIKRGTSLGTLGLFSGTVGAARFAARAGVPALAISQGEGSPPDFPAAAELAVEWLDREARDLARGYPDPFAMNLNVPTCSNGEVRGIREVSIASNENTRDLGTVDCDSGDDDPDNDVEAFLSGFASLTRVPSDAAFLRALLDEDDEALASSTEGEDDSTGSGGGGGGGGGGGFGFGFGGGGPTGPVIKPGEGAATEDPAGSVINLPVRLDPPASVEVTVDWSTDDDEAVAGQDYVATSGRLVFAPFETDKTIRITVVDDCAVEPGRIDGAESLRIVFSNARNATVARGAGSTGTALILDNDRAVTLLPGAGAVVEGDVGTTTLNVPVRLSHPANPGCAVTASWRTSSGRSGEPRAGRDFIASSGVVTFAPGDSLKTVPITVLGDVEREPGELWRSEWLGVGFDNLVNARFSTTRPIPQIGLGLITDDD